MVLTQLLMSPTPELADASFQFTCHNHVVEIFFLEKKLDNAVDS